MAQILKTQLADDVAAARRDARGLAGFNLDDLAGEGRLRLQQCREEVERMLAEARQQAVEIHAEAESRGHAEGLERATADVDKRVQTQAEVLANQRVTQIDSACRQLHGHYNEWMATYADSLHAIALAATEKLLGDRIDREPELLLRWVAEAINAARSASGLVIAVHPETLADLGQQLENLLSAPDLPESCHVEPDESVPRDGVVVRQAGGQIDAGLTAQLHRLTEVTG